MEPTKMRLKNKYSANKSCKQMKSTSNHSGKSKVKIPHKGLAEQPKKVMLVNGATGHAMMVVVD